MEVALNYPYAQRIAMTRTEEGIWELRIGPLEPRLYSYCFYLDGVAVPDPSNRATESSIKVGWSLVDVLDDGAEPGAQQRIDIPRDVPRGVVHRHFYRSTVLERPRRVFVYTPPGHDGASGLPVVYLRHGAEQIEDSWLAAGRADAILDNLIFERRARPMLMVFTNGYLQEQRGGQLDHDRNGPNAMSVLADELIRDVVPFIEDQYAVSGERSERAIAGLSMGAGQAFLMGMRHLDTFGTIGEFSSGVLSDPGFDLAKALPSLVEDPQRANRALDLLWLGCGADDRRTVGHRRLCEALSVLGIEHSYTEVPGSHEWRTWRALLAEFLPELFGGV